MYYYAGRSVLVLSLRAVQKVPGSYELAWVDPAKSFPVSMCEIVTIWRYWCELSKGGFIPNPDAQGQSLASMRKRLEIAREIAIAQAAPEDKQRLTGPDGYLYNPAHKVVLLYQEFLLDLFNLDLHGLHFLLQSLA